MNDCRCEHCGQIVAELVRLRTQRKAAKIGSAALARAKKYSRVIGPIPFGKILSDDGVTLIDDSAEAKIIAGVRNLFHSTMSYRAIAAKLNADGIPAKRGGKWYAKQVRSIILRA